MASHLRLLVALPLGLLTCDGADDGEPSDLRVPSRLDSDEPISLLPSEKAPGVRSPLAGKYPWTGMQLVEVDPLDAALLDLEKGVLKIVDVRKGSPAAKSDVQAGDYILGWNTTPAEGLVPYLKRLAAIPPGGKLELKLLRGKRPLIRSLVPGAPRELVETKPDFKNADEVKALFDDSREELDALKAKLEAGLKQLPRQEDEDSSAAASPKSDN
ncbi:MAG: PDZ domain-containing protein [Verrucomicrobiota bacterium]